MRASVKSLKDCPKLKRLLITYNELTEDFFAGIHSYLPNIKVIEIYTKQRMSDQFFKSLSSMKYLQRVFVDTYSDFKEFHYNEKLKNNEEDYGIKYFNSNCGIVDLSYGDDDMFYEDDDDQGRTGGRHK